MEEQEMMKVTLYCCCVQNCSKEYKNKFNLKKHMEIIHFRVKPFKCDVCQQEFVSKQNLLEHSFIHSGLKPYKCSYCGNKFRQISQLSLHRRIHNKNYAESLKNVKEIELISELNA